MTKHPGNPYWSNDDDEPISIIEKSTWEEAERAGYINAEHRIQRMRNKAMHALELMDEKAAWDEDGFALSLVADGIQVEGGVRPYVYPDDHPPPHVHVMVAKADAELKIALGSGELLKGSREGTLNSKEIKSLKEIVLIEKEEDLKALGKERPR